MKSISIGLLLFYFLGIILFSRRFNSCSEIIIFLNVFLIFYDIETTRSIIEEMLLV